MDRIRHCGWTYRPKSRGGVLASLALLGWMIAPSALLAQSAFDGAGRYRIETGGSCLNLRPLPRVDNEPMDCLGHGLEVEVLREAGPWRSIRLPDGRTGWSIGTGLAKLPDETAPATTVALDAPTEPAADTPATEAAEPKEAFHETEVGGTDQRPGDADQYSIGVGDVLMVEVFGLSDLNRKVRVLRDGTISLPLLGNLRISGLDIAHAEERISRLLIEKRLVKQPQVSIFVEEFVSLGTIVQGAVEKPGVYPLTGPKSLLELIGEAGGLLGGDSERAGGSLYVLRGDSAEGRQRIDIDIERLVDEGDISLDIQMLPGDIVMVPHARTYKVYVSGAAAKPGPVSYLSSDGITLLQAVTAAGGPTERANLSGIFVLRTLPDGSQERIKANLKKIGRGREPDIPLQKNDVVVIGEWIL